MFIITTTIFDQSKKFRFSENNLFYTKNSGKKIVKFIISTLEKKDSRENVIDVLWKMTDPKKDEESESEKKKQIVKYISKKLTSGWYSDKYRHEFGECIVTVEKEEEKEVTGDENLSVTERILKDILLEREYSTDDLFKKMKDQEILEALKVFEKIGNYPDIDFDTIFLRSKDPELCEYLLNNEHSKEYLRIGLSEINESVMEKLFYKHDDPRDHEFPWKIEMVEKKMKEDIENPHLLFLKELLEVVDNYKYTKNIKLCVEEEINRISPCETI